MTMQKAKTQLRIQPKETMKKQMTVLVVDDSSVVRKIIGKELVEGGYQVVEVADGASALRWAMNSMADLVTLDIEMPGIDGFETCQRLHCEPSIHLIPHGSRVPVIFVTSNDNLEDRKKGFESGAADFITKPFAKGELLSAVNKILKPDNRLKGLTALIVDDSVTARSIVSGILRREGLNVIEAQDGGRAFEIITRRKAEIDMIITDFNMPGMQGIELCRKVRTELELTDMPIILLTGMNDQSRLLEVFKAGVTDYLVKPFVKEELFARLTVHLERTHLTHCLRETITELKQTKIIADTASQTKNDFLANMSHEIRTPLNAIIGLTDLALKAEPAPALIDYLSKIKISSHSLLNLINDFLDYSRIESGKLDLEPVCFQLEDVMKNLADVQGIAMKAKGLAFTVSIGSDVPRSLIGDPLRLGQILYQLTDNALKFTESGKVMVRISLENESSNLFLLKFSVKDTGIGITPQHADELFQPFTQADASSTRKYGGAGLGLAICKRLTEFMHGQIWVESRAGGGSAFFFTAEFQQPSAVDSGKDVRQESSSSAETIHQLRGAKILVVEDNAINQQIARELLENEGMVVSIANNGREAVAMLSHGLESVFDAVLMDIQMPEMDGYEATREIRKSFHLRQLPIIAMTANAMANDRKKCLKAGMNEHLAKPINSDKLFSALLRRIKPMNCQGDVDPEPVDRKMDVVLPLDLPQIDVRVGLKNVGGNIILFNKLLLLFEDEFAQAAEQVRDILNLGDVESGKRLMHNLKGVSGNLGMSNLQEIARNMESAFEHGDRDDFVGLMDRFEKCLLQLFESIKILKAKFGGGVISEEVVVPLRLETIADLFTKLANMLRENELVEDDLLNAIRTQLEFSEYKQAFCLIEEAIGRFDYVSALTVLDETARSLSLTLS